MLPANILIDYEKINFENHIETLKELDNSAKTSSQPMFYSWVNVTCHPEVLQFFKVDQFQIPTVVYYYPEKELQANLIGKFDVTTIADHESKFLKGRLSTMTPK